MKATINPFNWISYSRMLIEVDKRIRLKYGDIDVSNIEMAASTALEVLTAKVKAKGLSSDEFAYILYSMNEACIAYQAVFSLEMLYGRIPSIEREEIVDRVAAIHYKLANKIFVDEFEYAKIYKPTYQRLNLLMPL
ncbi:MAG: hypothetical protein DRG78_17780 [Epsilonproteobacteria bacterium]|nr:MAG: hypothetical protein DRG78_17780 [Campylobacterota bacterium]